MVLSELQILLRPTLGEHIEIREALQDGVWPIFVDRGQLEAALVNLAVNARDAMPDGGTLTLETCNVVVDQDFVRRYGEGEPGPYVMITVTDTGCGIPDAIRAQVFDPFFTTKEVGKGTGLGLSMVYGFIKQSGGHITLYSEVGHGTTFRIYLPRARERSAAARFRGRATRYRARRQRDHPGRRGRRDGAQLRHRPAQGARLHTRWRRPMPRRRCDSASRASAFDLLFTDIVMPGKMNGVQLATAMAQAAPES